MSDAGARSPRIVSGQEAYFSSAFTRSMACWGT